MTDTADRNTWLSQRWPDLRRALLECIAEIDEARSVPLAAFVCIVSAKSEGGLRQCTAAVIPQIDPDRRLSDDEKIEAGRHLLVTASQLLPLFVSEIGKHHLAEECGRRCAGAPRDATDAVCTEPLGHEGLCQSGNRAWWGRS